MTWILIQITLGLFDEETDLSISPLVTAYCWHVNCNSQVVSCVPEVLRDIWESGDVFLLLPPQHLGLPPLGPPPPTWEAEHAKDSNTRYLGIWSPCLCQGTLCKQVIRSNTTVLEFYPRSQNPGKCKWPDSALCLSECSARRGCSSPGSGRKSWLTRLPRKSWREWAPCRSPGLRSTPRSGRRRRGLMRSRGHLARGKRKVGQRSWVGGRLRCKPAGQLLQID